MQQVAQTPTPGPVRRRTRAMLVETLSPPAAPVEVPAANRVVEVTDNGGPVLTQEMKATLEEYVEQNSRKNTAARLEKAAKKKLHELMAKAEVEEGSHVVSGKTWDVTIAAGEDTVVDVALLKTLVDEATFMTIISATQSAVTKAVGTNLLAKCSKTTPTEKTLGIKSR